MFVLYFLLILLFISITFVFTSTIIKFSLFCTLREKYDNKLLIIPSFLCCIMWSIIFIAWYKVISIVLKLDLFDLIFNIIINEAATPNNIFGILLISIGFITIGIVLQALIYLMINIDYNKPTGKFRMFIKKLLKINMQNQYQENENIVTLEKPKRITFLYAVASSIFSFSLIFFSFIALFAIGHYISGKIV